MSYNNFGSSVPRKSYNSSLGGGPYYNNFGQRKSSIYSDPDDFYNGGKRRKTKGKKSRKMKGGLWSFGGPAGPVGP